ncbi:MAG: magnesium chelatase domain-containing protein [Candidatus Dojkabacteria bacterium]|nr:magnesium chelatase domain-containing protein [Candidatus Dojkabacteria bacterium]MDQ7020981.1 magnesium chelatase domain-containing protein [Candidatus Dojkabacteria bacterium]
MIAKLYTAALVGLDCKIVEVEVDYRKGNTHISIVGLADKSIQEANDRIPSAIINSGAEFIPMKIIMNLAPAELNKSGPSYDFPLALGYLLASRQIHFNTKDKLFIGELALDGRLRPVKGILPIADAIHKLGYKEIYLPIENADEASLISGIKVYGVNTIKEILNHFDGITEIPVYQRKEKDMKQKIKEYAYDFAQVKGQEHARRALEIAAAGGLF